MQLPAVSSRVRISSPSQSDECIICRTSFVSSPSRLIAAVACTKSHLYHLECLGHWFEKIPLARRRCLICHTPAFPITLQTPRRLIHVELYAAALANDVQAVRQIMTHSKEQANQQCYDLVNDRYRSLFSLMLHANHREVALAMVEEGLDLFSPSDGILYPLHLAAWAGDARIVDAMLKKGVEVDCPEEPLPESRYPNLARLDTLYPLPKVLPIKLAAEKGHCQVVRLLHDAGSQMPLVLDNDGYSSLFSTAFNYHQPEVIRLLFSGRFPVEKEIEKNLLGFQTKCLQFLITAIATAQSADMIDVLLAQCNTEAVRATRFLYPLWIAVKYQQPAVVERMLRAGFKNHISNYGETLRAFAQRGNQPQMVALIDQYGVDDAVSLLQAIGLTLQYFFHTIVCRRRDPFLDPIAKTLNFDRLLAILKTNRSSTFTFR